MQIANFWTTILDELDGYVVEHYWEEDYKICIFSLQNYC